MTFTPYDWYWDNGSTVFSSKTQTRVAYSDPAYQAWLARGNTPTKDPGDAELREVLKVYEIGLTPAETAAFTVQHTDLAALKAAYNAILSDCATVQGWPDTLTNAQRDLAIHRLAIHLERIVKGMRLLFQRVT